MLYMFVYMLYVLCLFIFICVFTYLCLYVIAHQSYTHRDTCRHVELLNTLPQHGLQCSMSSVHMLEFTWQEVDSLPVLPSEPK